ncbi:MAG TPA: ABC transporter ATP-binding protein, partial [Anaerolineales bacterium]
PTGIIMHAVELKGITKRFGEVIANRQIDFSLRQGEIQALLGENGAGKTTLMRILYGLYTADEGQIIVNGQEVEIKSPKDAIRSGIGMVTQHFTLVPTLTVAENVVLGYTRGFRLNMPELQNEVAKAASQFGIELATDALVRHLSVGERQRVEILKSLYRNARVLILDEPTAVLVPQEVEVLFETLQRLKQEGMSIVFISHKLYEVMAICDRITVLRDGQLVGTVEKATTNQAELARMMVGRETFGVVRQGEYAQGGALQIENLSALDEKGLPALKNINLELKRGEILGIAGVSGNGQTELSQVLSGTRKPHSGKILLDGQDLAGATPAQFTALGVGRIPEDRHSGIVAELDVAENLALENLDDFVNRGFLDRKTIHENAKRLIAEYQIKASPTDRIRTLSGGNIQKVLLARALANNPQIVIAAQPTRGLDVGATEYVRTKLLEQRNAGAAVLLISEDLDEVITLSDRIAVIYEGRIMGVVPAQEADIEQLGLMMSGALEVDHA